MKRTIASLQASPTAILPRFARLSFPLPSPSDAWHAGYGSYCSLLFEAYKLVYFLLFLFLPAQLASTSFSYMRVVHVLFYC